MANTLDGYGAQFFTDQDVLARDMNMIGYTNVHHVRNYLSSVVRTAGVVLTDIDIDNALKVTTVGGTTFSVEAGAAIDYEGRVIVVPISPTTVSGSIGNDPLYHPALPVRRSLSSGVTAPGTYYVNLAYVPMYSDTRYDDSGDSHYTRVYDSYQISVDATQSVTGITLAQVILDASGSIVQDSSETGYLQTDSGVYYSIYDSRPVFKMHDGAVGDLETLTGNHEEDLNEELVKGVGFLYPQQGHHYYTKVYRSVTVSRLDLFAAGSTGSVTMHLYSGSSISSLKLLGVVETSVDTWTSHALNLSYYPEHILKFYVSDAGANVTQCTANLVYTRR